jgi:hypothetical protein
MEGRLIGRAAAAAVTIAVAACSPLKMDIQAGARPGTDFGRYTTYAWKTAGVPPPEWPAKDDRAALDWQIRPLIDRQMAARGYQLVGNDGADLLVGYHVDTRERDMEDSFSSYAEYRAEGGTQDPGTAWVQGYEEGTLVIELTDAQSGQLAWYGSASAVVNPRLRDKRMPVAVEQIFARFPRRRAVP